MFNLLKQGKIDKGLFAFYLGINGPGELTIGTTLSRPTTPIAGLDFAMVLIGMVGGVDSGYFTGDLHYVPLKNASYWAVPLDGVTVSQSNTQHTAPPSHIHRRDRGLIV